MRCIRARLYRWGYRPRPGTIFYSPSLELVYASREFAEAFRRGLETGQAQREGLGQ